MTGRIFLLGDNIDTDQLAPGRYMGTSINMLAEHCLDNAYPNFSKLVSEGDILFAGNNFGAGSSREQAVEVLRFLKVSSVIALSFAGIFYRNAINLGLPALVCEDDQGVRDGDLAEVDFEQNRLVLVGRNCFKKLEPIPDNLMNILDDGGLIPHLKKRIDLRHIRKKRNES